MAFKQYTKCIDPFEFQTRAREITITTLLVGTPAALITVASGRPDCLWIVPLIMGMAAVVAYCRNWLYHRLICLGGNEHDEYVCGAIVSIEPPSPDLIFSSGDDVFDLDWDTDFSINILLQNTEFGVTQEMAQETPPYGELIRVQDEIITIGLPTSGAVAVDEPGTGKKSAVLHAEFEGAGNYDLLQGAEAGLGFAIAALVACLLIPPPFNLAIAGILAAMALILLIVSALVGNYDYGSPSDVGVGELQGNTADNNGLGIGADVVYVKGTWVCDSLHGWNEIHPIKFCEKVGVWTGDWNRVPVSRDNLIEDFLPPDFCERLHKKFEEAEAKETQENQERPEHQWQVHPALDGCDSGIIL